jgi:hypothetical protein
MPFSAGAFGWTAVFHPTPPTTTTWNFLMDGMGEISLFGSPAIYLDPCSESSAPPTLTVTEAVLIVDADFPIAVEPSTWGKIKALYR